MTSNTTSSTTDPNGDSASSDVLFHSPQSQFSPDGLASITGSSSINDTTTINLSNQNYRMGKFMQELSKIGFEGLQEVKQQDGNTIWAADMQIDNQDFNFTIDQNAILNTLNFAEVQTDSEIEDKAKEYNIKAEQTYIVINGKKYFTSMNIPMNYGSGENYDFWINIGVYIVGDGVLATIIGGIVSKFGWDAFNKATKRISSEVFSTFISIFKKFVGTAYEFMGTFLRNILAGETTEFAITAAKTAAGESWIKATEKFDAKAFKYTVAGIIIIVGLTLLTEFGLHQSYQHVSFYNLTNYQIDLDNPYIDEGNEHSLPTSTVLPKKERKGPGGKPLGTWYNGVAFSFTSDSEFHGLGYTMRFKMTDPKKILQDKTFSCLFDVPYAANNSLYASTDEPSDYSSYYSANSGNQKVTQYSANDGSQEIIVTYDYIEGKHQDPESGQNLYLYNSIVVIRDMV